MVITLRNFSERTTYPKHSWLSDKILFSFNTFLQHQKNTNADFYIHKQLISEHVVTGKLTLKENGVATGLFTKCQDCEWELVNIPKPSDNSLLKPTGSNYLYYCSCTSIITHWIQPNLIPDRLEKLSQANPISSLHCGNTRVLNIRNGTEMREKENHLGGGRQLHLSCTMFYIQGITRPWQQGISQSEDAPSP